MQRFKKPLVWLSLLSLLISLIPAMGVGGSEAYAADLKATTYFAPDDRDILKTANLELGAIGNGTDLRQKVKVTYSPTIAITGSYSKVSSDTLSAQVDLLSWDNNGGSNGKGTWVVDRVHSAPGAVLPDNSNSNLFNAPNLTLFPGLNRITLKGSFGLVEGSETFYVLYDKVPYYTGIAITGSGFLSDISLNEGTRVVVKSPQISLTGKVYNTSKVTVTIDGKELSTDVFNNELFTPSIKLSPGLNKLAIKLTNGSDSLEITREVYYFTDEKPFIDIHVLDNNNSSKPYDLLTSIPTLKNGSSDNDVIVQMMIPFSAGTKEFAQDYKVSIDTNPVNPASIVMLSANLYNDKGEFIVPTTGSTEDVIIEDSTGPAYRLVTFQIKGVPFQHESDGSVKATQSPKITVNYGSKVSADPVPVTTWGFESSYTPVYKLSNLTSIKNIYYLPDYVSGDNGKVGATSKLPLNNAAVNSSDFYIMVETDGGITTADALKAKYLPLGTKELSISTTGIQALDKDGVNITNTYIYKITGFANGVQKVRFEYPSKSSTYDATISYSSISGILVDNLVDGQTYKYNSKLDGGTSITQLVVSGEYFGFDVSTPDKIKDLNAEYSVNGINIEKETDPTKYGSDTKLIDTTTDPKFPKFSLSLNISKEGPLVAGANTIEFRGRYKDAAGNYVPIVKSLRIYIVDENVADITQFHPGKVPQAGVAGQQRPPFPAQDDFMLPANNAFREAVDEAIRKIIEIPTEFTLKDGKYTTSEQSYDVIIRGSGTSKVNLYFGSEKIFSIDIPGIADKFTAVNGFYPETTKEYYYEVVGNSNDFLLRIRNNEEIDANGNVKYLGNFQFAKDTTGTHVYNLELINETGARTNQRMEITREVAPYRLLAPQPTVGDQYVVNKNFVRFDIEAEGATKVIIGKDEATPRTEPDKKNRFTYDYVGLKPDKLNKIKIQIVRGKDTINDTIEVYYTSQVGIDTQFMAEKVTNKYSVFNKQLELSFPKGTIMQSASMNSNSVTKYYPDTKLLFGIADPNDGVVERRNDYGIYFNNNTEISGNNNLLDSLKSNFTTTADTFNFTRVSNIYWISGGVGELGDKGVTTGYKPATNGLAPYSTEGFFTKFEAEREIVPSQRGSLKLTYNSNVVDEAGSLVTVFKYTEVGGKGRWTRVPGEVNTKAHTVTIPFDEFGYYAVYKLNRSFSDITNHPWARNILNALYSKGIMEYLRSDAFGADDLTTRGEFATLLVKGLSLPLIPEDKKQTFFDVPFGAKTATWDYEHLETAARAGIITGRTEGFFSPNTTISRQDAAVMIARALKLKLSLNDAKLKSSVAKSFLDSGKIDYYALPAVEAVTKAKIMSGSPVTLPGAKKASFNFNPQSDMTRAEAGKIAVELLKKSTNIFPKNFS
ncbi:S-layer homology domain-containing protein [Paenibacillus segetis]|uniref:SLH domain-containing protein n=1 Tax=Paenibacillus segetis TaxID=1325360 RepID=A0ABQ1YNL5_9BACL|nr:S-layer homology domain-containing protein [Paenibacillus segetis]GGH32871.1 hypothetical protein GCM10008013_37560 [Paenibacillus segetis]